MLKFYHSILICFLGISLFSHAMETRSIVEIAATGSEDEIITLVNDGFDTDRIIKHNGYRGTLLQWAVKRGLDNAIKHIIRSTQARHPEDIIATGTEQAIISLIRSRYFDINRDIEHDGEHGTVLHWAARRGFVKVLDCIKAANPDANLNPTIPDYADESTSSGLTPLFLACNDGQTQVLDWYKNNNLMNNNPNPAITEGRLKGWTLLHGAGYGNQPRVLDWYKDNFPDLMNSNPNPVTTDDHKGEWTVLDITASFGGPEIFDWYYKNYPETNTCIDPACSKGKTPLRAASYYDRLENIEWFAKHKFDLDAELEDVNLPRATALGMAVSEGKMAATRYLVFLGSTLEGTMPPAMLARTEKMKLYLEQTAPATQELVLLCYTLTNLVEDYKTLFPPNQTDESVDSAQEPPTKKRRASAAEDNPKNDIQSSKKPAEDNDRLKNLEQLIGRMKDHRITRSHIDKKEPKPHYTRLDIVKKLLKIIGEIMALVQDGAEIDAPVIKGHIKRQLCAKTPLHWLANTFFGDTKLDDSVLRLIHWLIEIRHANINAIDLEGNTPLSIACTKGHRVLVQFLLEHGADPRIGNNPLVIALANNTHNKIFPIIKYACYGYEQPEQPDLFGRHRSKKHAEQTHNTALKKTKQ